MARNIIKVGTPRKRTLIAAGLAVATMAAGGGAAVAVGSGPSASISAPGAVKVAYPAPVTGGAATDDGPDAPTAPGLTDRIPAGLLPADAPIPVGPEILNPTNAWHVSDGARYVAVYAGSAGNDPSTGRFWILRQFSPAGTQTISVVDVPGSGAVTIVDAPTGPGAESSGSNALLHYTAADGSSGVLNLGNDTTGQG